ncbi:MAG: hydrogenase formation protein HypD [Desulfamplus sp.]|nr:hydrogenase formation protein HypD [Desulfamplus sp.]
MALKYVSEYRDGELANILIEGIRSNVFALNRLKKCENLDESNEKLRFMEVCGTHTMSIFRHGIRSILPDTIELLSGPGCPVCVTAQQDIDAFIELSQQDDVILATFGDLIKVPGSFSSLQKEKAKGRDIRVVYSVFDAVEIAAENKRKEVIFCGVGFETTTPTVAASIIMAKERGVDNFSIHSAHKLTPPALSALMQNPKVEIDGFILPGHVSVITGTSGYQEVFDKYRVPSVIAGFEPVDILKAILMLVKQAISGVAAVENGYERAVSQSGNIKARDIMNQVFEPCDTLWRGIGLIPQSGMKLKKIYSQFDALEKFKIELKDTPEPAGCACGQILMGLKTPELCIMYGKRCTPSHPIGPCMVSSEGACAAYYRYKG